MLCQRGEGYRPDSVSKFLHSDSSSPALNENLKQLTRTIKLKTSQASKERGAKGIKAHGQQLLFSVLLRFKQVSGMEIQTKINSNNEINYPCKTNLFFQVQWDQVVSEQNQNSKNIMLTLNPLKIFSATVPASSLGVH